MGNRPLPNSNQTAINTANGASAAAQGTGMVINQLSARVWNGASAAFDSRQAFYRATNIVDNSPSIPDKFKSGAGRADLINMLLDGSMPSYDINGKSVQQLRTQGLYVKGLMQAACTLAQKNKIDVDPKMISTYNNLDKALQQSAPNTSGTMTSTSPQN